MFRYTSHWEVEENSSIRFYCESGYKLVGHTLNRFICGLDGWDVNTALDSNILPRCSKKLK